MCTRVGDELARLAGGALMLPKPPFGNRNVGGGRIGGQEHPHQPRVARGAQRFPLLAIGDTVAVVVEQVQLAAAACIQVRLGLLLYEMGVIEDLAWRGKNPVTRALRDLTAG